MTGPIGTIRFSASAQAWAATVIILLNLVGALMPSPAIWGLNFWSTLPVPLNWAIPAGALLTAILLLLLSRPSAGDTAQTASQPSSLRLPLSLIICIALLALFYVLRSRGHVYGDGFLLLQRMTDHPETLDLRAHAQKPLTELLFQLGRSIGTSVGLSIEQSLAAVNAFGGLIASLALYRISTLLAERPASRLFLLATAAASGAVILFFGYIEYYTWGIATGLWSLALTVGAVKEKNRFWPAIAVGLLSVGFHLFALPFLLTAIIGAVLSRATPKRQPRLLNILNLSAIIGAALVATTFHFARLPQFFVPIIPLPDVPYSVLMPEHLLDILNEALLVAPVALFALLASLLWRRRTDGMPPLPERILGTAALLAFLVTFWIEPKLGAARDWDLLSFFAFPASLWAGCLLLRRNSGLPLSRPMLAVAVLAALIHIAPNLYEKIDLHRSARHLDAMITDVPQHRANYGNARRAMVWGITLRDAVGDPDLAVPHFRRRLAADSTSAPSWFSLGEWHLDHHRTDSALICLRLAFRYDPNNVGYLVKLIVVETTLRNFEYARVLTDHALAIAPDDLRAQKIAGLVAVEMGDYRQALPHFQRARQIDPSENNLNRYLGLTYYNLEEYDSAYVYLYRAAQDPDAPAAIAQLLGKLDTILAGGPFSSLAKE